MSVRVMARVWDEPRAKGGDKLVLLAIADCCNDEGLDAWPSVRTLAGKSGFDERTVRRHLRSLLKLGFLTIGTREGRSNVYRVVLDTPVKTSPLTETTGDPSQNCQDHPSPNCHPEPEVEPSMNRASRRSPQTSAPKTMELTSEMRTWAHNLAEEHQVTPPRSLAAETEAFLEYHQAKGTTFKDWGAAWHTWMRKAVEFTERDSHAVR